MEKIDFVIPWVDGNDKLWREEKRKYIPNDEGDDREIRFRDNGLLRYWFRGIEKFAPWVNKVYFVTCGHKPEWLNINHPKLEIICHTDYIPNQYLPTFSSHVIELNFHRIKDLSEKFVYFNDDFYLIKNVKPNDFFINDLPCDCLVESAITPRIGEFSSILCETVGVINKNFSKKDIRRNFLNIYNPKYKELLIRTFSTLPYYHIMGFYNPHICQSFRKSTFNEVWSKEYDILHKTCMNRFRGKNDVSQYLFRYWQLCKGEFVPQYPIGKMYNISSDIRVICNTIEKQKYKVIAINDTDDVNNIDDRENQIKSAFMKILPDKSSYEL
ncbi:MAG: Stealth CR1 domain-containing protein [Erysipelotrichaceae bacterium]|nr:Stealth CR1 domain-containing protein [Erysipelotrichaceae bacterium]